MKSYTLRPDTFTLNFNVTLSGTTCRSMCSEGRSFSVACCSFCDPVPRTAAKRAQGARTRVEKGVEEVVEKGGSMRLPLRWTSRRRRGEKTPPRPPPLHHLRRLHRGGAARLVEAAWACSSVQSVRFLVKLMQKML